MLRVIVEKNELSTNSEVQTALEQVFIKDVSAHFYIHVSLGPDKSPSSCNFKNIRHDAATTKLPGRCVEAIWS